MSLCTCTHLGNWLSILASTELVSIAHACRCARQVQSYSNSENQACSCARKCTWASTCRNETSAFVNAHQATLQHLGGMNLAAAPGREDGLACIDVCASCVCNNDLVHYDLKRTWNMPPVMTFPASCLLVTLFARMANCGAGARSALARHRCCALPRLCQTGVA